MVIEAEAWLLCLSCSYGKLNKKRKGTDRYIHCLYPRIHPQFNITYFRYFEHPLISCHFYKENTNIKT